MAGALIGVGAVAAAPFTGGGSLLGAAGLAASLSGAGTIAGAVGAGVAGAAAGGALGRKEENDLQQTVKDAVQKEKAKNALREERLKEDIKEMLANSAKREQFIVTAFAVGICTANCDGEICAEELEEIDLLVSGIGTSEMLSKETKSRIEELRASPPTLQTVWSEIERHQFTEKKYLDIFGEIIQITIEADNKTEDAEKEFLSVWNNWAA